MRVKRRICKTQTIIFPPQIATNKMITEEIGVEVKITLGQIIGVTDVKLLTPEEYREQTTPQEWFPENPDGYIIQISLYGEPEKFLIKKISNVCFHTRSQIHYTKDDEESEASTAYLCPTENDFTAVYTVTSDPDPAKLTK